jgi:predicted ATPase/class 3 adenylate cyclase/DNA-binding CsgD family transcriptional regulator
MPDPPTGTVTFLFTEIDGSNRLWETSSEAMKSALTQQDALLRNAIEAHQGYIFKVARGAFCAAFSTPYDALSATLKAQYNILAETWSGISPLRVRMALHTGSVQVREGNYSGSALNRLAHLLSTAHGGQILLSFVTAELVRDVLPIEVTLHDLGEHRLNDLISTEHIFQLTAPDLPANFPPLRTLEALPNNLPLQLTSFVGREREIAEVKRLLTNTRLLTLTGIGGAGKTRLALQVAAEVLENFRDGVWLVELARLFDGELVPKTVGLTLGMREEVGRPVLDTLIDHLRTKHLLIVLDNCEHLIEACAILSEALLRAIPTLHILATSREPLGIGGETNWRVPPLSLPDTKRLPPLESLTQYEAVQLFIERAVSVQPGFALTSSNALAVAQICQQLDGIPLAIELAAARVKMLSVEQIALRLDERFLLLTGGSRTALPRQQTLRATIDWSYELLAEAEQALLRRLSVFAGGWTLEAAEAVCAGEKIKPHEVLDLLTQLINKSLVLADEQEGEVRYQLLETMRSYAAEKLREAGEREITRRRHYDWFVALAEEGEHEVSGAQQAMWLERLEQEHDNLRAVLRRSLKQNEIEIALRLCAALWWFWSVHGHRTEGRQWLDRALTAGRPLAGTRIAPGLLAKALNGAGMLALTQDDLLQAEQLCWESLALFRTLGDQEGSAIALARLGMIAWVRRNYSEARSRAEEALTLFRALNEKSNIADSLNLLAYVANSQGEYAQARSLLEESLALFREARDKWGIAYTLYRLAQVVFSLGDFARVRSLLEESLTLSRELGYKRGIGTSFTVLGQLALYEGDAATAHSLLEESLATFREQGDRVGIAESLALLARVAAFQGDYATSRTLYEESLAVSSALGDKEAIASCFEGLGAVLAAQGHADTSLWATRLWGAAEALREAIGAPMPPLERATYEQWLATVRTQLGEEIFAAAWAQGQTMTPEQALASEGQPMLPKRTLAAPPATYPAGLTIREVEVLRLVARGLTDAEVAEILILSPRTVSTHLRSIYNKLGVTSRSAATRFAVEHDLT